MPINIETERTRAQSSVADQDLNFGGGLEAKKAEWGGYARCGPSRWMEFRGSSRNRSVNKVF